MKVFDGPGMIADKADAPIVPVRIDGAQFTPFSRLKGKVRLRWLPEDHADRIAAAPLRDRGRDERRARAARSPGAGSTT